MNPPIVPLFFKLVSLIFVAQREYQQVIEVIVKKLTVNFKCLVSPVSFFFIFEKSAQFV
jgi:hypothetical protein